MTGQERGEEKGTGRFVSMTMTRATIAFAEVGRVRMMARRFSVVSWLVISGQARCRCDPVSDQRC